MNRAQSVAASARDAIDLAAFDGAASDFTRRPLTLNRDFDALRQRREPVGSLDFFPYDDVFFVFDALKARRFDAHFVFAGSEPVDPPFARFVRYDLALRTVGAGEGDGGAGERGVAVRQAHAAQQIAGRRRGWWRLCPRLHGQRERVAVRDDHRDRHAITRGGRKFELERGRLGRLVEAIADRLGRLRLGYVAFAIDGELEQHVRLQPGFFGFGGVLGVLEVR